MFLPLEILKSCVTPLGWKFQAGQKPRPMEIPLEFFLNTPPQNSSSSLGATSLPMPFCHTKCQYNVLGGWVGKNIFITTLCMTKRKSGSKKRNSISKEKIYINKN